MPDKLLLGLYEACKPALLENMFFKSVATRNFLAS